MSMGCKNEDDDAATNCPQDVESKRLPVQSIAIAGMSINPSLPSESPLDGRNNGMRLIRRISRDELKASSYSATSNLSSSDSSSSSSSTSSSSRVRHLERRQYLRKRHEDLKLKSESNPRLLLADKEGMFVMLNDLDNTDTISSLSDNERGDFFL